MLLGILSDTHNHLPPTRAALTLLLTHGARHLIHCGDSGPDVLTLLSATCQQHNIRAHVAIGNCDRWFLPTPALRYQIPHLHIDTAPQCHLHNHPCAIVHGDDPQHLERLIAAGNHDYIFTGHTHQPENRQVGATRILNPGSCARPRGRPPSVLLLDLATHQATWRSLDGKILLVSPPDHAP